MMFGQRPFFVQDGELCLEFKPALPGWMFDERGTVTFTFLGCTEVTYHNPSKTDVTPQGTLAISRVALRTPDHQEIELSQSTIGAPYAEMVRTGQVRTIDVYFAYRDRGKTQGVDPHC
jgi:hypothetical protein